MLFRCTNIPNVNCLACSKFELLDLTDCTAVNGENCQVMIRQGPMSKTSHTTILLFKLIVPLFIFELWCAGRKTDS